MTQLMTKQESLTCKLWQREEVLRARGIKPIQPKYSIVWEDPNDLDSPAIITTATPMWLAMALHGDVLPPLSVFPLPVDHLGNVQPHHKLHDDVIPPMTEEEATEYMLQRDVPKQVWDNKGNAQRFKIVKRTMVPTDRQYRDAWRLAA